MYDTITKYNNQHHTPLSNMNSIEAKYQVILEEQVEENNFTFDIFHPHRNKSENLIDKISNLTIDDIGN